MAKAILFTNWTDEDFIHKWDGVDYTFKKKKETYLQDHLAYHFAKHLAIREMNKMTESWIEKDERFLSLMKKCLVDENTSIESEDDEQLETILINEKKKTKTKKTKKVIEKDEEEEFDGLKDETSS